MAPELEFRFTIGYLLLFVAFAWLRWRKHRAARFYANPEWPTLTFGLRRITGFLFLTPLIMFIYDPASVGTSQIQQTDIVRFLGAAPAAIAILWLIWACRATEQSAADGEDSLVRNGPYERMRHPQFAALCLFFWSLAFMTARVAPMACAFAATLILRFVLAPLEERQFFSLYGDCYRDHAAKTGCLFFFLAKPKAQYRVPQKFGMSAVLALVTTFAFVFGGLNFMRAPPAAYLFVASEITAICLVQIFFGSAPRGASAVTGSILLPFWVLVTIPRPLWMPMEIYVGVVASLLLFGAILGYFIRALAAGFFLVLDLLEPYLPGHVKEESIDVQPLTTDGGTSWQAPD